MRKKRVDVDALIERAYYKHFTGRSINMLDIGKIFAAGRAAYAVGQDVDALEAAVVATGQELVHAN